MLSRTFNLGYVTYGLLCYSFSGDIVNAFVCHPVVRGRVWETRRFQDREMLHIYGIGRYARSHHARHEEGRAKTARFFEHADALSCRLS